MKPLPTQKYLQECFEYDPETGKLYWKERPLEHFKNKRAERSFNSRFPKKEAFKHISHGYCTGRLDGELYKAHRIIYKLIHGYDPENVLHSYGNTTDNRIEKLSDGDQFKNMKDMKRSKKNVSGITGVSWHIGANKWQVKIYENGNQKYLGLFSNFFEACCTRKSAEVKYEYHPNHGKRKGSNATYS